MAEVVLFKPKSERDAEANLRDFIEFAKEKLTTFSANLDFESNEWDVTAEAALKARNTTLRLRFTCFPSGQGKRWRSGHRKVERPCEGRAKRSVRPPVRPRCACNGACRYRG